MNTTALPVRPDVTAFVTRVRELLADLPEEDRLELTEGLEADLTDQVTESGGGALGDPEAYARELRTAAGLDPAPRRRVRGPDARSVAEVLDSVRGWWDVLVERPQVVPAWSLVAALRPVRRWRRPVAHAARAVRAVRVFRAADVPACLRLPAA